MKKQEFLDALRKAYEKKEIKIQTGRGFYSAGICAAIADEFPTTTRVEATRICMRELREMGAPRIAGFFWPIADWTDRIWAILLLAHWIEDEGNVVGP